jgi:hypothetical protein
MPNCSGFSSAAFNNRRDLLDRPAAHTGERADLIASLADVRMVETFHPFSRTAYRSGNLRRHGPADRFNLVGDPP